MPHERDETIDGDRIAVCEARVRHFGEPLREEVVLRSGHDAVRYAAEQDRAMRSITAEARDQESTEVAQAFSTLFCAEKARLRAEKPALASIGELPAATPPAPPSQPEALSVEPADDVRPAAIDANVSTEARFVPSYLLAPAVASVEATPVVSPVRAVPSSVPSALPPVEIRPAPSPVVDLDATQPPLQRKGATLPFARDRDVPDAVRAAWAEARAEAERAEEESERKKEAADKKAAGVDIDETAFLPRSAFTAAATPFEKKAGLEGDEEQVRAAVATPEPWIPLEEYAAFLAELAQDPTRAGFLRAKYGIAGEDAQRALGAGFAAIFQRDPSQRVRFDALIASERAKRAR